MSRVVDIHCLPDDKSMPDWRAIIMETETAQCLRVSTHSYPTPYDAAVYAAKWAVKRNLPVSETVDDQLISMEAMRR